MKKKKPNYISHYLVLRDLIAGIDVRAVSDSIHYLTSRIENIKCDFVSEGILFDEEAAAESKFSSYKPYVLIRTESNIANAKKLLERYSTEAVLNFLAETHKKISA